MASPLVTGMSSILSSSIRWGGSLSADLKLIRNSWVFGADIQNLTPYANGTGKYVTLGTQENDTINVHLRGGNILIMQQEAMTTHAARQTDYELLVAFDDGGSATGEVFLDDGEVVEMAGGDLSQWSLVKLTSSIEAGNAVLKTEVVNGTYAADHKFQVKKITYLGLWSKMSALYVNGVEASNQEGVRVSSRQRDRFGVLDVTGLSQPLGENCELKLEFTN